jgi:hypothetical protein
MKGVQHAISNKKLLSRVFFVHEGTPIIKATLPSTIWRKGDVEFQSSWRSV